MAVRAVEGVVAFVASVRSVLLDDIGMIRHPVSTRLGLLMVAVVAEGLAMAVVARSLLELLLLELILMQELLV